MRSRDEFRLLHPAGIRLSPAGSPYETRLPRRPKNSLMS